MLNNAWPSLIWHLWDWYLRPGGGYFGAKKACQPLHVQLSPLRRAVVVVSDLERAVQALEVRARLLDHRGQALWSERTLVDVRPDSVVHAFDLPPASGEEGFLRLDLTRDGQAAGQNLYWLSPTPDVLDHANGTWFYTPQSAYADFRALESLPPAALEVRGHRLADGDERHILALEVQNMSETLAFFTRLRLLQGEREILPVFWSDNFVSALPGETLRLRAELPRGEGSGEALAIEVSGWNTARQRVTL
jgi:exo-1,4-beta-D-glucosaminidase